MRRDLTRGAVIEHFKACEGFVLSSLLSSMQKRFWYRRIVASGMPLTAFFTALKYIVESITRMRMFMKIVIVANATLILTMKMI